MLASAPVVVTSGVGGGAAHGAARSSEGRLGPGESRTMQRPPAAFGERTGDVSHSAVGGGGKVDVDACM